MSVLIVRCLTCGKVEPYTPGCHTALMLDRAYHGGRRPTEVRPTPGGHLPAGAECLCKSCAVSLREILGEAR